jgi:hypothetical protein
MSSNQSQLIDENLWQIIESLKIIESLSKILDLVGYQDFKIFLASVVIAQVP